MNYLYSLFLLVILTNIVESMESPALLHTNQEQPKRG